MMEIPKKTHWTTCPQCDIRFGTIFPRDDGLCITCVKNNELISLKESVEEKADWLTKSNGDHGWENTTLAQFARDVLKLIKNSELKLEG